MGGAPKVLAQFIKSSRLLLLRFRFVGRSSASFTGSRSMVAVTAVPCRHESLCGSRLDLLKPRSLAGAVEIKQGYIKSVVHGYS
jgi:hypothetical protein